MRTPPSFPRRRESLIPGALKTPPTRIAPAAAETLRTPPSFPRRRESRKPGALTAPHRARTARAAAPLLLIAALASALSAALAPAVRAQTYEALPPELEERARGIYAGVMCPQCAGQTLDQSSAPIAEAMKSVVRTQLLAGATDAAIIAALVESYGEGVLASPPTRGFSLLAWLVPPFALLIGAAAVAAALRNRRARVPDAGRGAAPVAASAEDPRDLPLDLVDLELGADAPGAGRE